MTEENRRIPPPPPPRPIPVNQEAKESGNTQQNIPQTSTQEVSQQPTTVSQSKTKEPLSEQTKNALFVCGGVLSFILALVCLILVFVL